MTDPAVYSLRFANRLDLGNDRHKVATDASRLVRRFQADWMSEGRRPAGVCGACLLVAARMNGHHRTPEEIAQIVKVSPTTIKRRLLEFAQTDMAEKTVEQWKSMTDADLSAPGEMQPPVVKQQEARDAKRRKFNDGITKLKSSKSKSRSRSIRARSQSQAQDEEEEEEQSDEEGRELRKQVKQSQMKDAIQAAVAQLEGEEDEDEEEMDLAPPAPDQYVRDLDAAGDNPEIAQNERVKAMKKFKRFNKVASSGQEEELEDLEDLEEDLEDLAEGEKEDEAVVEGDEEDGVDKEEKRDGAEADVDDPRLKLVKFDNWDDPEAVRKHVEEKYMPKVRHESALTDKHMEDRLSLWMGVRDPKQVMYEFEVVNRALRARDKAAKGPGETEFDDVDDEEIDRIWMMEENEQRTRARMWLSHNGKWLEEDKGKLPLACWSSSQLTITEKQWKREQYEINNADKIQRRVSPLSRVAQTPADEQKQKRKQRPMKRNQPYNTPREAMEGFMAEKNFSSRLNLAALKELGLDPGDGGGGGPSYGFDGLQAMDEKDDDGDEKDDDNEKYEPGTFFFG
jgi:transcription factor IIIB subunit 2